MRSFWENNFDVAIIGGGPAGVSCAWMASKLGLKTVLVEKNNYLGGQITGGLVVPMMKSATGEFNTEFYDELLKYSKEFGAQITYEDGNDGWFNPVVLKIVLEKMLVDNGVKILYEAEISNKEVIEDSNEEKTLKFLEFKSKTLSIPIYSKYFVDATGDSKICEFLNCDFIDDNENFQPETLRFIISNVDLVKFSKQILELDKDRSVTSATIVNKAVHLSTAYTFDPSKNWGLSEVFKRAVQNGDLKYTDTTYFQVFTIAGMPNSVAFNCPRLSDYNKNGPFGYSDAVIDARGALFRIYNFMKKYFDGFSDSFISQIADMTGVRVSKRPKTKYIYKLSDLLESKTFENTVLQADYPVDIHSNKEDSSTLYEVKKYYLPLESLMVAGFNNLFVAGRNVGAEFKAQAALRIQKSCLSMGEGVAKYIKSKTG